MTSRTISFLIFIYTLSTSILNAQQNTDHELLSELNNLRKETSKKRDTLIQIRKAYFEEIKNSNDSLKITALKNKVDENYVLADLNDEKEVELELNFVGQHLNTSVSLDVMLSKIKRYAAIKHYNRYEQLFQKLAPEIQKSEKGQELETILKNQKRSAVGAKAVDFTFATTNGNQTSLSTICKSKKLVLLDFWASWCAPCVEEIPILKLLHKQFSNAGFEIIALSEDQHFDAWKKAIAKYGTQNWIHTNTTTNPEKINEFYFRNAIPTKILIDTNGTIIARWRGGGEANKADIQKTITKYFETNP